MRFAIFPGTDGPARGKDPGLLTHITSRFPRSMSTQSIATYGSHRYSAWTIPQSTPESICPPRLRRPRNRLLERYALQQFGALVPGTLWETKHWHPERFAEVGQWLKKQGFERSGLGRVNAIDGAASRLHSSAVARSIFRARPLLQNSRPL